jgi:glycosyltransferase involved in cell wall biosynthesis
VLVIIGDGPGRRAIERQRDALGLGDAVLLPGFQDNPYAWMRRADVFALSSRYEGLPTVLIEALACGARVVATDCPSGSAEILEDGRWGTLVPVGDAPAFAAALLDTLPRGRWPRHPSTPLERFRPDAVLDRFAALIDGLVDPGSGSSPEPGTRPVEPPE